MVNNRELTQNILSWLEKEKGLVLVPHGRLARRLRLLWARRRLDQGQEGWIKPRILTLKSAIKVWYQEAWPQKAPAEDMYCLRLWHQLSQDDPPPLATPPNLQTARQLEKVHSLLVSNGLDPLAADGGRLCAWRARLAGRFSQRFKEAALLHPARLSQTLAAWMDTGRWNPPPKILAVGLTFAPAGDQRLLTALEGRGVLTAWELPRATQGKVRAAALADMEHELLWLGREVALAARALHQNQEPLASLAVVLPDVEGYQEPLRRTLEGVLGKNDPRGAGSYFNLALAAKLVEHPLFQAGLLPLRVALAPARRLLVDLFLSPYFGVWRRKRTLLARADLIWRDAGLEEGELTQFTRMLETKSADIYAQTTLGGRPLGPELARLRGGKRPTEEWLDCLEAVWRLLEYPVLAGEADETAWRGLREIVASLRRDLKGMMLTPADLAEWLRAAAGEKRTTTRGDEEAGVQVVGLMESRGLYFDEVFVPGLSANRLPRPVPRLPLLSPAQRRLVPGGSAESQYRFARGVFAEFKAAGDGLVLSRPLVAHEEPLLPSPFWPRGLEERPEPDFWQTPDPAWLRASWVRSAWQGFQLEPSLGGEDPALGLLPPRLGANQVERLLRCPFQFFMEVVLGLSPWQEPAPGLDPRVRGTVLHEILHSFTTKVAELECDLEGQREEAEALLRQTAMKVLEARRRGAVDRASWEAEQDRLLGGEGDEERGLLLTWLDLERERWLRGWRFHGAEVEFQDLKIPGVSVLIHGRVDRVDQGPDGTRMLWDYKTGHAPDQAAVGRDFTSSQLLVYLAAARAGLVHGAGSSKTGAGFWQLRSQAEVKSAMADKETASWSKALAGFSAALSLLCHDAGQGLYPPNPAPAGGGTPHRRAGICAQCGRQVFCHRLDAGSGEEGS